jgi:hypothetical protein
VARSPIIGPTGGQPAYSTAADWLFAIDARM